MLQLIMPQGEIKKRLQAPFWELSSFSASSLSTEAQGGSEESQCLAILYPLHPQHAPHSHIYLDLRHICSPAVLLSFHRGTPVSEEPPSLHMVSRVPRCIWKQHQALYCELLWWNHSCIWGLALKTPISNSCSMSLGQWGFCPANTKGWVSQKEHVIRGKDVRKSELAGQRWK